MTGSAPDIQEASPVRSKLGQCDNRDNITGMHE